MTTPGSTPRAGRLWLGALAAAALVVLPAAPAHAETLAPSMVVDGRVSADGTLTVRETITLPPGSNEPLVQRIATSEAVLDDASYRFQVDEVTATAAGVDLAPQVTTEGNQRVIQVDTARAMGRPVVIGYRVVGAARTMPAAAGAPARTEVSWPVLQGLSVGVRQVSGTIATPGTISFVNCTSGPVGSPVPCNTYSGGTHDTPQPTFTDGPRAAGDEVRLDFALPATVVAADATLEHHWSMRRAFRVDPASLLAALLPLLLGGALLWWLHRRLGRDAAHGGGVTPVAEFTPVGPGESRFRVLGEVRPGHVGTVADERVDPVDVTATLLDLAVRGWLRIVELPRDRSRQALDWAFERREHGEGELRPFEATLREAVAPAGGQGVLVSQLPASITPVIGRVQDELYDEVVRRSWFERRPDTTRSRWSVLGWVALAAAVLATALLVAFTGLGLLGVALVVLALGALLVGQEMPRRTGEGTALLAGLSALSSQLQTQPTGQLPAGQGYGELSRILPYAVVLGGRERWLDALVAADRDETPDGTELEWYHAPADWHLRDLPDSLNSFVLSVQGVLSGR